MVSYDDKKKGAVLVDQAVERNKRVRAKDPDDKRIEAICEEVVSTFERAYKVSLDVLFRPTGHV